MAFSSTRILNAPAMEISNKHEYQQVSHDKEDTSGDLYKRSKQRPGLIYTIIAAGSSTITLAILLIIYHISSQSPTPESYYARKIDVNCGSTVSQARSLGCKFDMMASRWEHPLCHDASLLDEVLGNGPWEWFEDRNHTVHVPRSEVAKGEFPHHFLHVTPDYHIGHCMYMWKKQHREFAKGGPISEDQWDYKHTHHCAKVVQGTWPPFSRTMAGFSKCRSVDVWERYENGEVKE